MTGMRTRSRQWQHAPIVRALQKGERWLSREELAAAAGITPARLDRLIRLGLVEPATERPDEFVVETVVRLRRMLRLNADLGVDLVGAAIIADLLARLDRLEAELARLGGSGP
jgi:chaperone modulatory protein CbpM